MYKKALYRSAYRILDNSTPLKYDCGLLCNKKCCSGDKNAGMHLYPGEEELIQSSFEFLDISTEFFHSKEILFAVCKGACDRKSRPLACRIYPLVPYFDASGKILIIEDPRAKYTCPIVFNSADIKINKQFVRNVTKVFQLLIQDIEIRNYILILSKVLDEYTRFVI